MSIYILVRGLTEGVSLKKLSYLLVGYFHLGRYLPIRFILIPFYTEATSFFTFCECLSIFSLFFYRVTKPRTWLRRIVLVILAQAVVLFNRNNTPRIFADYWRNYCWIRIFVYLSQRYQRLSMTAFLIALIGFTTLAPFIVPNDIYERDVYHSMTRGVMKDSKVPDKRMSEGGINPQYGLQKGTFLL